MNIPLKVRGVLSDPNTEAQIVILKDPQDTEVLPIWVGVTEGNAIRLALEGVLRQRPQPHDLIRDTLDHFGVQMEKVVITEINENVYYATLHLIHKRAAPPARALTEETARECVIDARPSDAIALALRMNAPIYASEDILTKKGGDHLDAWMDKLKPSDHDPDA